MAYRTFPDFESFWVFAIERALNRNDISHHPCCDVWSTRSSKRLQASHTRETKWKMLMASLDSVQDKRTALRAKMLEEGWRMPVIINRPCQTLSPRHIDSRLPFRLHTTRDLVAVSMLGEKIGQDHLSAADNNSILNLPSHQRTTVRFDSPTHRHSHLVSSTKECPSAASRHSRHPSQAPGRGIQPTIYHTQGSGRQGQREDDGDSQYYSEFCEASLYWNE